MKDWSPIEAYENDVKYRERLEVSLREWEAEYQQLWYWHQAWKKDHELLEDPTPDERSQLRIDRMQILKRRVDQTNHRLRQVHKRICRSKRMFNINLSE
jgi:hypothetical protein